MWGFDRSSSELSLLLLFKTLTSAEKGLTNLERPIESFGVEFEVEEEEGEN